MTAFVGIGIIGHFSNGELGMRSLDTSRRLVVAHGLGENCEDVTTLRCATSDKPEVVVWGDSLAMHLVDALISSNPNIKLVQFTKPMCGPFFNIAPVNAVYPVEWARECLDFTKQVQQWLISHQNIKYVVISSSYGQYLENSQLLHRDGILVKTNFDIVQKEFQDTLNTIRNMGIQPIIVSRTPTPRWNQGQCTAKAASRNLPLSICSYPKSEVIPIVKKAHEFIKEPLNNS